MHHRISSAYHPHANYRAEVGVKSSLQATPHRLVSQSHANLPEQPGPGDQIIPSNCACLDDLPEISSQATQPSTCPTAPGQTAKPQRESTVETIHSRKGQMGRAHSWTHATEGRRCCQTGRHPTRWDKTGIVVEVLQYHQYGVRTDGSGR